MPKLIGIPSSSLSAITVNSPGACYTMAQQFLYRSSGLWVQDPYAITVTSTALDETTNTTLQFNIITNLSSPTLLYWNVVGSLGIINSTDFTTAITGNISVASGARVSSPITLVANADMTTEGPEAFYLELRLGAVDGTLVYKTGNISLADTSFNIAGGGNIVYTMGAYRTHVFTSNGTFNIIGTPVGGNFEYLVIGPGGNAGTSVSTTTGGSGGSGGIKHGNIVLTANSYTISVGTTSGTSSSIVGNSIIAIGYSGGNGGNAVDSIGSTGNSGSAGAGGAETPGPAATGGSGGNPGTTANSPGSAGTAGTNGGGGGGGGSGGGTIYTSGYAGGSGGTYIAGDFGIASTYGTGGNTGYGTQGIVAIKYQAFVPPVGQVIFDNPGTTQSWTVPANVSFVSVVAIGGGGGAYMQGNGSNGGNSSFGTVVIAGGGGGGTKTTAGAGGTVLAGTGGAGGAGSVGYNGGGGGAGGYAGSGADAVYSGNGLTAPAGGGGGGGSGNGNYQNTNYGQSGGGVGAYGQGSSGTGCTNNNGGNGSVGGAGGGGGYGWYGCGAGGINVQSLGDVGGGGGGGALAYANNIAVTPGSTVTVVVGKAGTGGLGTLYMSGAVRIIWGPGRSYPSTLTTDQTTV